MGGAKMVKVARYEFGNKKNPSTNNILKNWWIKLYNKIFKKLIDHNLPFKYDRSN